MLAQIVSKRSFGAFVCLGRLAVLVRRPLPDTISRYKQVFLWAVPHPPPPPSPGEHFFTDFTFASFTLACSHARSILYSSMLLTDLRGRSGFFHFSKVFLTTSFLVLPLWTTDLEVELENFVQIQLYLAIDQHPVQIKPGVNSDLGNGSFWVEIRDTKIADRCIWRPTRMHEFDRIDWPPTSKDGYFRNACNGRVWKQFRCLRLS